MGVLRGGEVQGLGWELRHPLRGRFEVGVKKSRVGGAHVGLGGGALLSGSRGVLAPPRFLRAVNF